MKSILVHLDASPRSAVRLALAQDIARREGGAVEAVYGVMPAVLSMAFMGGGAAGSALEILEASDRDERARARAVFDAAAARAPVGWSEAGSGELVPALAHAALFCDLLVLGQTDPEDTLAGQLPAGFVASLIADSGKPALVLPFVGDYPAPGREILIGWKATPESARAVAAAMPWLRRAERVHVAYGADGNEDDRPALERWLRHSGVTAPIVVSALADVPVGEALLSLAADIGADLLVMGCYGHSRAREWVLGGATHTVLRSMTLPVLMAH